MKQMQQLHCPGPNPVVGTLASKSGWTTRSAPQAPVVITMCSAFSTLLTTVWQWRHRAVDCPAFPCLSAAALALQVGHYVLRWWWCIYITAVFENTCKNLKRQLLQIHTQFLLFVCKYDTIATVYEEKVSKNIFFHNFHSWRSTHPSQLWVTVGGDWKGVQQVLPSDWEKAAEWHQWACHTCWGAGDKQLTWWVSFSFLNVKVFCNYITLF